MLIEIKLLTLSDKGFYSFFTKFYKCNFCLSIEFSPVALLINVYHFLLYVCMYVCMYVYMYVCMYVYMYVCIYVCMYEACMYECIHECLHVCMY